MDRLLRTASLGAIALLLFGAWMHIEVLDPTNIGWTIRGSDWGASALGLHGYLNGPSDWPSTYIPILLYPDGVHLLMMDGNPLLGLMLKPFAAWLPADLQVIGPWMLLCLLLHVAFAQALLRPYARDFLNLWLGTALLTMLPTLYARFLHANLCAHWLILWALWIFADPRRSRNPLWWLAVIGVAGLVHNYLLLMVGAIWASAMLNALASGWRGDGVQLLIRQVAPIAVLVTLIGLIHGIIGGDHFVSTGSYGAYPMPLDALINPGNPSFALLLPSTPDIGRSYEGMQYLGAGLLALSVAAVVVAFRAPPQPAERAMLVRLVWLTPALAVLTLLAISEAWWFQGRQIMYLPLPQRLIDALDMVRASGRLFWPVAYTLMLVVIVTTYRLPAKGATALLAIAFTVQIIDMAPLLATARLASADAVRRTRLIQTPDPRWDALIARASGIEFEPPTPFHDLGPLEEIGWRAVSACRPMRYMYTARVPIAAQARLDREEQAYRAGRLDPTRLYILFSTADVPPPVADKVRVMDGVRYIPPTIPGKPMPGCVPR